jgi:Rieske Fe-S protein
MHPSPDNTPFDLGISRRKVLGLTVAGAAGLITAACGGSSATKAAGTDSSPSASGAGSPSATGSSAPGGASSGGLVATAKVPVGGGVFVKDGKIIADPSPTEQNVTVVTQPASGTFKAFNATCTHQQCTVGSIQDGKIICPCHGSIYSVKDGAVLVGPAQSPLASIAIKVEGTEIVQT